MPGSSGHFGWFLHFSIFNQKVGKYPKAEYDKKICSKVVGVSKNGQK
jgi:hypothetical protein